MSVVAPSTRLVSVDVHIGRASAYLTYFQISTLHPGMETVMETWWWVGQLHNSPDCSVSQVCSSQVGTALQLPVAGRECADTKYVQASGKDEASPPILEQKRPQCTQIPTSGRNQRNGLSSFLVCPAAWYSAPDLSCLTCSNVTSSLYE